MRKEDKEFLDLMAKGIRAEIKAGNDMIKYQIDGIIERQDKANHRTTKLEEFFKELHDKSILYEKDYNNLVSVREKTIKRQWIYLVGGVIAASILASIITQIGLIEFIKIVK
jgi:hypothetical protein